MRTIEVYKFEDLDETIQDNVATLFAKNNGITKEIARSVLEKGYYEFYKDGETAYIVQEVQFDNNLIWATDNQKKSYADYNLCRQAKANTVKKIS